MKKKKMKKKPLRKLFLKIKESHKKRAFRPGVRLGQSMLGTTIFQRGWKKLEEKLLEQQYIASSNFDIK